MINNPKYQANVQKVNEHLETVKALTYEDYKFYTLDVFYVISYWSTYKAARKYKTYKTYGAAIKAWENIVSGTTPRGEI